ncbi:unnamed protein product [Rhizoctonia solani]|uniref:Uncharacterized protein n=1 Tax=Rhizoctonia solani TaxID=456999 RepID=A0A8H3GM71_9AGAM|nr:unnamed protein product [Rhizoctonia solani]
MEGSVLGINAGGNPVVFDKAFLSILGKLPTTTLVDESGHVATDSAPGPSSSRAPSDNTTTEQFDPELLGLTGDKSSLSFIHCMRQAFESGNDDVREEWEKAGEKLVLETLNTASPTAAKRRERMEKLYRTYVYHQDKTLERSDQWKEAVFRKHWVRFLAALLTTTKGVDGGPVRVNTFNQWCTDLVWLVGRNLVDEQGQRVGTKALTTGGLYAEFRGQAARSIQFDLNRTPSPRLWIGQLELLLIYQDAVQKSEKYGRASVLQTILATSMVFHIGARVGSLGWSNKQYLDEEKYMKCKDIRIERMDYGIWDAEVTVMNRKGWNSASDSARPITYRLSAVTKTHNLFFDTPSLLLLHLWIRRALKGIKSIQDIFDYKGEYFEIEESMKEEPLFLERGVKGQTLGERAASAIGMTASLQALGKRAGFPITTFHALRRDAASVFALVLGAHVAQLILGHHEADTVLNTNYTKGALSVPITEARLGLLDDQLSLANRVGLQRHRREGQVAVAMLTTGFRLPEQEEATNAEDTDGPIGSDVEPEERAPETSKQGKQKEVQDNSSVTLSAEQIANVKNHPSVLDRTHELERCLDELYLLFPPAASKTHGGRAVDKLSGMVHKYHEDPTCIQNQERIAVLVETIRQASLERKKANQKLMKQERRKVTRESISTQQKTPKVHLASEVQKARARAEEMAKVVNLPKPSEQLKASFYSIHCYPDFGESLLSEECRQLLSTAGAKDLLEAAEADEAEEPGYQLADEDEQTHDENGAPKIVSAPFTDIDELKVLDVDLVQTKKEWMARLAEPLIIEQFYKRLAEEHDGKFPCLLCRALPDKHKPITPVTKKKGQDMFTSRPKLHRHEANVHTPWFDLMQYMITDDAQAFKCPSAECRFRADSIEDVREHCVTNCKEREVYKDMEQKHELAQQKKRREPSSWTNLQLEKQNRELRGHGLRLEDKIIQGMEKISTTSPEEAFELASKRQIPESEVRPHLHGLAAINERWRMSVDGDGLVKDPYVNTAMEKISKVFLTPEIDADIDARMAKKR